MIDRICKAKSSLPTMLQTQMAPVGRCNQGGTISPIEATRSADMKPSIALQAHREAIRKIVAGHRASNPRIFGSVLQGCDTEDSDLDLLVDPTPETTLLDIGAIRHELLQLLGVPVDVLTPKALPESFRATVLAQAVPV
jgi:predicted nucleotidyltransferase